MHSSLHPMPTHPPIRVTIWNEFVHERQNPDVAAIYPNGIHGALEAALAKHGDFHVHTATLDEPEEGLPPVVLDQTDVLLWWGHAAHDQVSDELVTRVQQRVLAGMGLIVLHSGTGRRSSSGSWARAARCAGAKRASASACGW
jgi:trehalose utilization protein